MTARANVTDRIPAGTVWMRDSWEGVQPPDVRRYR